MKHTPGPWSFDFARLPNIKIPKTGAVIARVQSPAEWKDGGNEAAANARLIAAAPELLASLKWAMGHLDEVGGTDNPDFVAAREAIAKAEGREP